jgi:hypothetical protein
MSDLPPPADPDASYLAFCQRWITKKEPGRQAMEAKTDDVVARLAAKLRV